MLLLATKWGPVAAWWNDIYMCVYQGVERQNLHGRYQGWLELQQYLMWVVFFMFIASVCT